MEESRVCTNQGCSMGSRPQSLSSFYVVNGKPLSRCKQCIKSANNGHYAKTKRVRLARALQATQDLDQGGKKICSKCEAEKPLSEFHKHRWSRDGHVSACSDCTSVRIKEAKYREKNHGKYLDRERTYRDENRGKIREYQRGYYHSNQKYRYLKFARENRDVINGRVKRWREKNPDKYREINQAQRAKRIGIVATISSVDWIDLCSLYHGRCAYCWQQGRMTLDHFHPLDKGGAHAIENAVPACQSCNSSKHKSPFIVWLCKRAGVLTEFDLSYSWLTDLNPGPHKTIALTINK